MTASTSRLPQHLSSAFWRKPLGQTSLPLTPYGDTDGQKNFSWPQDITLAPTVADQARLSLSLGVQPQHPVQHRMPWMGRGRP